MNAGIAFISRKSRKADVAWRYASALGRWRGSRRYVRRHCRHWQMAQPPRTQGSDRWPESPSIPRPCIS